LCLICWYEFIFSKYSPLFLFKNKQTKNNLKSGLFLNARFTKNIFKIFRHLYLFNFFNSFFFLYEFLFKFIKFSLLLKNKFFFRKFCKFDVTLSYLSLRGDRFSPLLSSNNNKLFNEYSILKNDNFIFSKKYGYANDSSCFFVLRKNLKICKNQPFMSNFHNLNFLFNFSSFNSFFKYHHHLHFFYLKSFNKDLIILNTISFLNRWNDGRSFLFNIYYYNFLPVVFGSFAFKNEILAMNWQYSQIDINFWKYSFPFFVFKTNRFGIKVKHFFNRILSSGVDFFLITDVSYHSKNLHYFDKGRFFTIGPVSSNYSPWVLSYSLPVFAASSLTEFFFLKLAILLEKNATFFKFNFLKLKWIRFMMTSPLLVFKN